MPQTQLNLQHVAPTHKTHLFNETNLIENKLVNTICFPITGRISHSNTNYALEPHGTLKYKRNNH